MFCFASFILLFFLCFRRKLYWKHKQLEFNISEVCPVLVPFSVLIYPCFSTLIIILVYWSFIPLLWKVVLCSEVEDQVFLRLNWSKKHNTKQSFSICRLRESTIWNNELKKSIEQVSWIVGKVFFWNRIKNIPLLIDKSLCCIKTYLRWWLYFVLCAIIVT